MSDFTQGQGVIDPRLLSKSNSGVTDIVSAPSDRPESDLIQPSPKKTTHIGQKPETKGERRSRKSKFMMEAGQSRKPRCNRCILHRKSCDGNKPTCGLCKQSKQGESLCVWSEGDPSRSELEQMMREEKEQKKQNSTKDDTSERGDIKGNHAQKEAGKGLRLNTEDELEYDLGVGFPPLCNLPTAGESSQSAMKAAASAETTTAELDPKIIQEIMDQIDADMKSRPVHTEGILAGLPDFSDYVEKPLPAGEEGEREWQEIQEKLLKFLNTDMTEEKKARKD